MPLFGGGKPTTTVSQYARWFHAFDGAPEVRDPAQARAMWAQAIVDIVAEKDSRFAKIDASQFLAELMAVRAELFGLAWGHAFTGKDKHLLGEALVAKEALTAMGLWERAEKYNQAAARSGDKALPEGDRARRGAVAFQNTYRVELFKTWTTKGVDGEVAARVLNRVFTEPSWKSGVTLHLLTFQLFQALGLVDDQRGAVGLSDEAIRTLEMPLLDIYVGSREGIAKNNIQAG